MAWKTGESAIVGWILALVLTACTGSNGRRPAGVAGAAGNDGGGAGGSEAGADAASAGSGGADAGTDAPADALTDGYVPVPTAASIDFTAENPLPTGEQILFLDQDREPGSVVSIQPDGSGATEIFAAYWMGSIGASHGGNLIAFSCADPEQAQHYGVKEFAAIENTFLYDAATQSVSVLSYGNINDQWDRFNASDTRVYVSRQYDFTTSDPPLSDGPRFGRIDIATHTFHFIAPNVVEQEPFSGAWSPQPTLDESELYFTRTGFTSTPPVEVSSIMKMALPNGTPELVRHNAWGDALSPDGTRYAYAEWPNTSNLYVSSLDGSSVVKVADNNAGASLAFSPDGTELAYLADNPAPVAYCLDIDVVHTDGSDAGTPTRVLDCSVKDDWIYDLAWIDRQ